MINPQNGWSKTRNHQWIVREFLLKVISPIVLMQWRGHSHTWEDLGLSIPNQALGIPNKAQPWGFEAFENISKVKFFGVRFNPVSPLFKSYIILTLGSIFDIWLLTSASFLPAAPFGIPLFDVFRSARRGTSSNGTRKCSASLAHTPRSCKAVFCGLRFVGILNPGG